jgi:hypothetical protein
MLDTPVRSGMMHECGLMLGAGGIIAFHLFGDEVFVR